MNFPFILPIMCFFYCQGHLIHLSRLVLENVRLSICHMMVDIKNESANMLESSTFCIIFIESKLSSGVKCIILISQRKKKSATN